MANEHDAWLESISRGDYDRLTGYSPAPVAEPLPPETSGVVRRALGDTAVSALRGAISVPEAAVGLADIPTGGAVGRGLEKVGFRPKEAKAALGELYSPEQRAIFEGQEAAKGFLPTAGYMLRNPSTIYHGVVESAPSIIAGGAAARGIRAATQIPAWAAGAAGEGLVGAGLSAEQIRQGTTTGYMTPQQSLAALASGVGTGVIGGIGGKVAQRYGLGDIETALAKGELPTRAAGKGAIRRISEGALTEGALEEMPQSAQEQFWQNVAMGRPYDEGVAEAAAVGVLTGGVMGGGVNLLSRAAPEAPAPHKLVPSERVSVPTIGMTPDLFTGEYGAGKDQYQQAFEDAVREVSTGQKELFPSMASAGLDIYGQPLTLGVTSGAKPVAAQRAMTKAERKAAKPAALSELGEKPVKKTVWTDLQSTVDDHLASGRITEDQHIELTNDIASRGVKPAKLKKAVEAAIAENKAVAPSLGAEKEKVKAPGAVTVMRPTGGTVVVPVEQKVAVDRTKKKGGPRLKKVPPTATIPAPEVPTDSTMLGDYEASLAGYLTSGIDPVDLALAEKMTGSESAMKTSVRQLAKEMGGISYEGVRKRAVMALSQIRANADAANVDWENAKRVLGFVEAAPDEGGPTGSEGGAAVRAVMPESFEFDEMAGMERGELADDATTAEQAINDIPDEIAEVSEDDRLFDARIQDAAEAAMRVHDPKLIDLVEGVYGPEFREIPSAEQLWLVNKFDALVRASDGNVAAFEKGANKLIGELHAKQKTRAETARGEAKSEKQPREMGPGEKPGGEGIVTGAAAAEEVKAKTKIRKRRQIKMSIGEAEVGENTQRVQDALSKVFFTPERMGKLVSIVEDEASLPKKLGSGIMSVAGKVRGFVDDATGRVYIIAKNVKNGDELAVLLHEVGVHLGMKNLVGEKNFGTLVTQIQTWALDGQGLEGKLARQARERVRSAEAKIGEDYTQDEFDEELMAYFVDLAVSSGISPTTGVGKQSQVKVWLKKFMDAVRAAIRKIGINPNTLTAKDLVDLAYGAAHLEMSGDRIQFGTGTRKFSISEPTDRKTVTYTSEPAMRKAERFLKKEGKYQTVSIAKTPEGTYEVTRVKKPGIKYSISAAPNASVWEKSVNAVRDFMVNPANTLKEHGLGWLTLTQLGDVAKKVNTAVPQYLKTTREMQSMSKEWVQKAAKIDVDWANVKDADALHETMRESTRASYDPSKGVTPTTPEEVALQRKYDALSAEAKGVYAKARDYYAAMREERRSVLLGILDSAYRDRIERAKESGDAKAQAEAEKELAKQRAKVDEAHRGVKGPYFPLMRLGDWYTVGMSAELAALEDKEDKTAEDRKKISELRKDTAHYTTSSYSSKRLAQNAAQKLEGKYDTVRFNVAAIENQATKIVSAAGLQDVESYLNSSFDKDTAAKIRDMMTELYYESLPEHHALKREMKREGVHGEEQDMRRVFAVSSMKGSHYLSRMKYADDVRAALFAIKAEGKKDYEAQQVYNEVAKRAALSMDPSETPWADKLVTVSYLAHLGMNPAFVLTNATQVPMITMPWLAARSNLGATTRAVSAATSKTYELIKSSWDKQGWRFELDWEGKVSKGQGDMLEEMLKRNLLDITMEHDLGAVAGEKNRTIGDWLRKGNLPVHITELANRSVTALAAYDLAVNQKKMFHEDAVDFAASAVSETQLDYSALNAPRHMQRVLGSAALARITMQFRKYQQGMLYLIGRSIQQAVSGSDAETRRIARRTLFGLATTTGVMAGSIGLPLAGSALWAASFVASLFGAPDEPWDAETEYKNWLAEILGVDAAEAVIKGLPAALLGLDLSKRVGLGDIAKPLPFLRESKTTQETTGNILTAAAGAPVGTIVNTVDGLVMMSQGDWMKGAEKVLPLKIAQNLVKAGRYEYEGMTKRNGEVVLPEDRFSAADIGLTAAGFQSTKASTYYEANAAVEEKKAAATEARNQLIKEYAVARMRGRSVSDIRREIAEFNKRHPEQGVRITMSALTRSIQARRRAERERGESGVSTGKANRPYLEEAKFAG